MTGEEEEADLQIVKIEKTTAYETCNSCYYRRYLSVTGAEAIACSNSASGEAGVSAGGQLWGPRAGGHAGHGTDRTFYRCNLSYPK